MANSVRDRVATVVARWAATVGLAVVLVAASGSTASAAATATTTATTTASTATGRTSTAATATSSVPAAGGTASNGTGRRAATGKRYAAPIDEDARPLHSVAVSTTVRGTCTAGSDVVGNVSVYRCFAGNVVYDPCWAFVTPGTTSATGVLCLPTPWSKSAVRILAPDLSASFSVSRNPSVPWGVELTTHQECLAVQGAHSEFRGQFIDFTCSEGPTTGPSLELLRGPNRHKASWTYRSVLRDGTKLSAGPVVHVQTAWFAGPSLVRSLARCQGSKVAVSAGTLHNGQGHIGLTLLFRNSGSATCSLVGYPGVAALDVHGRQVLQAQRAPRGYLGGLPVGTRTPAVVVLAPSQIASALVEGTDPTKGQATGCAAYPALLVTPPNTGTSVRVAQPLPSCSALKVHPVVVGDSGTAS